jgi:hypothetical protein
MTELDQLVAIAKAKRARAEAAKTPTQEVNVAAKESQLTGGQPFPELARGGAPEGAYVGPSEAAPEPLVSRLSGGYLGPQAPYGQASRGGLTELAVHGAVPFADELQAGFGALIGGGNYQQQLNQQQGALEEARRDYPGGRAQVTELIGALAGGGAPIARAVAAPALSIGQRILRGLVGGGAYGAVYGAGEGSTPEERGAQPQGPSVASDLETRLQNAITGGVTGAAIGGGINAAVPVVSALARRSLAPVLSRADPELFAAQKVAEAMQRDRLTPGRLSTRLNIAQVVKPETTIADVAGTNAANLLRAASNVPSQARSDLVRGIEARQGRQLGRLQQDINQAFGDTNTFYQTNDQLVQARAAAARPLWEQARATPTPYTQRLQSVLDRPLMRQLVERTRTAALNRGEDLGGWFGTLDEAGRPTSATRVPQTDDLHRIRISLDEVIRATRARQETGLTSAANLNDLTTLRRHFNAAIENPAFHRASREFASDSAPIDALNEGYDQGLRMEPEAIQQTLADLAPAEREMWRRGFARSIVENLRDTGRVGANRAETLASPRFQSRLMAAIPDQAARREFLYRLNIEQRMARTRQAVQGQTTTARQLAEGQEAGAQAQSDQRLVQAAGQIARGDFGGALMSYLSRAANAFSGLTPQTADQIIRLLASRRPADIARARILIGQAEQRLQGRQRAGRAATGLVTGGAVVGGEQLRRELSRLQ